MEPGANQNGEKMIENDDGFVWQDYLDATETIEVPQIMFPHVELTLQSGIEIGMSLEVPTSKIDNDVSYWVATIVMACGPLLRLRYFGGDDRLLEFWFNLTKEAAHELGWCVKNNKKLIPPEAVLNKSADCVEKLPEFLATAKSVAQEMLSGEELSMSDRIKQGMKIELNDSLHPYKLWVATIIENVGGRLLLRYDTPGNSNTLIKDFWMFCTSESLHQYSFASRSDPNKWFLEPPSSIVESHAYEEWKELIGSEPKNHMTPENLFIHDIKHAEHKFDIGMKLEAVSPGDRTKIAPATIVKIFDDIYFLVQLDDYDTNTNSNNDMATVVYDEKRTWLCTAQHPYIFPIEWAKKHNLQLTPPRGWSSTINDFNWDAYLIEAKSTAANSKLFPIRNSAIDAGFEVGMRLEVVDPQNENIICAAHITKINEDLLWVVLDNYKNRPEHVVHMHSLKIFPVGWCESNHYPLKPPRDYIEVCKKLEKPEKDDVKKAIIDIPIPEPRSSLWCPKIYFNYRCFTGPMISKGKLATLPKAVGPGPVILVMREVLSMIVSVGYRSARILKVLQCDSKPDPGYHLEVLKAKHKSNTYRANVAVVTSGDMVADFCRSICKKLMVCPNLFGPFQTPENECPDKCHKTSKNKFTSPIGNGKRGKPKGYTSILVQKPKPWGRKRRRRRGRWANRHKNGSMDDEFDQDIPYLSMDLAKHVAEGMEEETSFNERPPLSEIDVMIEKDMQKSDKSDSIKNEIPSSNASDDSRSSFNDRKSKDSNLDSPNSVNSKGTRIKYNQNGSSVGAGGGGGGSGGSGGSGGGGGGNKGIKRESDWEDRIESDGSDPDAEYVQLQKKQRRPKTRKLESNPLFWSVDDVFRYLRKTNDCKDIAYRVRQEEIDGLAFLLLNLPSLTEHMKLRTSIAMKLCRHVEQVKVTFFLRHINEDEPGQN